LRGIPWAERLNAGPWALTKLEQFNPKHSGPEHAAQGPFSFVLEFTRGLAHGERPIHEGKVTQINAALSNLIDSCRPESRRVGSSVNRNAYLRLLKVAHSISV
jgi:hypothetical protein